ncbi:MAG: M48 family metallopeptidase [Candidatus Desulfatibia sp.]|uniref:M48 family metallopeptidase n=1 Tax=Candidatus Desulfatibia sp. TaxID=3101189 RepID=UPI002F2E0971
MISINSFLLAYIAIYLVTLALDWTTNRINLKYLEKYGQKVPDAFEDMIDEKELQKINRYTIDNIRFKLVQTGFAKFFFLFIILSGILPWLTESLAQTHFLLAGLIFFAFLGLISSAIDLPFDYYHSFVIEAKYGFNTKTLKIWISDLVKSVLVMAVLGTLLLSALLLMVKYTGQTWWLWAWAFLLGFQILMTILYPTVIAPLFNKFTPLEDPELESGIEKLAAGQSLDIKGIFQMDATRRTRHTNAYFTGLGKAKQIVLFDSLLAAHGPDEILAILAHEIGHLKKNHIKKQLVLISLVSLLLFFLASKLLTYELMYKSFGFPIMPHYVGLFLIGVLWEPVGFFLSPLGMAISRKFERQADFYSSESLNTAKPLTKALKKMAKDNFANLQPHPLYVWFNYSHPPLLERIKYLEAFDHNTSRNL